jgi:hypothetical protein
MHPCYWRNFFVKSPLFFLVIASVVLCSARITLAQKQAATPAPTLVILPFEGDAAKSQITLEVEKALNHIGKSAQRSSLKLDELLLVLGCSTLTPACLQEIGHNIKANTLILGKTVKDGDAIKLTLRLFDVQSGKDQGLAKRTLTADEVSRFDMTLGAVQELFGIKVAPTRMQEQTGGLNITTSVPYVAITLNGQPRSTAPLELRDLKVGMYTIAGERPGYFKWEGKIEVKADQMAQLEIEMTSLPPNVPAPSYANAIRLRTWIVAGGGVASLLVGTAFGAHMKAQQDSLNQTNSFSLTQIQQMEDLKQSGERDAVLANVFFSIGGAAILTACIMSYFDYRTSRRNVELLEKSGIQFSLNPTGIRFSSSF